MKQRELEIALSDLQAFEAPDPGLEQYSTPSRIAADVLYLASGNGDIIGKTVIDLGCGNGIFAIGASLMDARTSMGVDLDASAIEVAMINSASKGCDVEFLCSNVENVDGVFDTCIQNPPFGSQKKHADVPFLHKAMSIAGTTYSIHNSNTTEFIQREVESLGGKITLKKEYEFEIRHTFEFHRKDRAFFNVTLFRIENEG